MSQSEERGGTVKCRKELILNTWYRNCERHCVFERVYERQKIRGHTQKVLGVISKRVVKPQVRPEGEM
jgi:hypothetical protein